MTLGLNSGSYVILPLSYLELMPQFKCEYESSQMAAGETMWQVCHPNDFCHASTRMDGSRVKQVKYDYSGTTSFHNYVERLDLACASSETIGMLGSAFFIGWTLFAVAIPRLADIYGRKMIFVGSLIMQAPTIYALILSSSVKLTTALLFVMGVLSAGRMSVGFLYIQEMVPAPSRAITGTLAITFDCMTMIWATIYFMYISHYTIYWEYYAVFQNVAAVCLIMMHVPESPKWLYEKGRFSEAKSSLMYLARKNGVDVRALVEN